MYLHKLDASTISKIGSSQVIASTYIVVKELIENSLDASSSSIDVKLENYGLDLIEVKDNGSGISREHLPYAAIGHHTSKISSFSDISLITSYGFRGEALGSMCAVSEVCICSRTSTDETGLSIRLDHNGHIVASQTVPFNKGTCVSVSKLFCNIPVRKKVYLTIKHMKDELKRVEDCLLFYSVIHPEIRFVLRHNGTIIWQKLPLPDYRAALLSALGSGIFNSLEALNFLYETDTIKIYMESFLPKVDGKLNLCSRSSTDRCFLYVNKRPVESKDISKIVKSYYTERLANQHWPVFFISFHLPPSDIDVNYITSKTEVLFRHQDEVFKAVSNLLDKHFTPAQDGSFNETKPKNTSKHSDADICRDQDRVTSPNKCTYKSDDEEYSNSISLSLLSQLYKEQMSADVVNAGKSHVQSSAEVIDIDEESLLNNSTLNDDDERANFEENPLIISHGNKVINNRPSTIDGQNIVIGETSVISDVISSNHDRLENLLEANCSKQDNISNCCPLNDCEPEIPFSGNEDSNFDSYTSLRPLESECEFENLNAWSRGQSVQTKSGQYIEPVSVMVEAGLKRPLSPLSKINSNDLSKKKKKIKVPRPPFIHFASEYRLQVIRDNPGIDLCDIDRLVSEKWRSLTESDLQVYRTRSERDLEKYHSRSLKEVKEAKLTGNSKNLTLPEALRLMMTQTSQPSSERKCWTVSFSLQRISALYSTFDLHCTELSTRKHLEKVGEIGGLLLVNYNGLYVIDVRRLREARILSRLLLTHIFSSAPLESPVYLNSSNISSSSLTTLQNLSDHHQKPNSRLQLLDRRIVSNGFVIHSIKDGNQSQSFILTDLHRDLPEYGVEDLDEVLQSVQRTDQLQDCRSRRVLRFLNDVAKAEAHLCPSEFGEADMDFLMETLTIHSQRGTNSTLDTEKFVKMIHNLLL